jgi:hypothetical protein
MVRVAGGGTQSRDRRLLDEADSDGCRRNPATFAEGYLTGIDMASVNPAKVAAALELADAILAEFNDPDGKARFGTVAMEKILAYRKIAEKKPRGRAASGTDSAPAEAPPVPPTTA